MECGVLPHAREVSRRVACHPGRASCNRRESRREAYPQPLRARLPRLWKPPPRRTGQAPLRSDRAPADYRPQAAILCFYAQPWSSGAPFGRHLPTEIPALAARLFDENNVRDFHPFIEGFAHVVDREGRCGNRYQGFHFHARLGGRGHCGLHFHAILAQPRGHINVRQGQWVTKRYPLRGPLGCGNSRNPRHFQGIPFRVFQPPDGVHHTRFHLYKTTCRCCSHRHRLVGHVDHSHFALFSVMRQLRHKRSPRRRPSSVTPKRSRRPRSFLVPPAPLGNSSPAPALQYHPSLATSTLSPQASSRATPLVLARNASARTFRSTLPPVVLRAAATAAPPRRTTSQSQAPQTIQTSPSSKPDCPANRTQACPGTSQTLRASRGGLQRHRKKTPRPWLSAHFPPGHTSPWRRRPTAPAHLLSTRARFFLPSHRCGPPHFPGQSARPPRSEPSPQEKRCCCFESEMGRAFRRSKPLRHPWKESPRVAAARIAIAPPRLAPPAPAPHIRALCRASVSFAQPWPRFLLGQCSAPAAPFVRIAPGRLRGSCAQSSPRHPRLSEPPRPS